VRGDEISDSETTHSAVPPGLVRSSCVYPTLSRWAKLGRAFQRLWVGILLWIAGSAPAFSADHPELPKGSECVSCHGEKAKGQSVHFDFTHACNVCHVVSVTNGKTSITLLLPKEKICYSCHEKAAMEQVPYMKGECVSCHDPHSSERTYLLRTNVASPARTAKP
jgi:predicted CXXCH cytochrome family protein